jgi:hypothetical protein
MDERRRGLRGADVGLARGVVAERPDVAVTVQSPVSAEPGRAPAEPRDPEPLQALREGPQLVEAKRLGGSGDVVLAHRSR